MEVSDSAENRSFPFECLQDLAVSLEADNRRKSVRRDSQVSQTCDSLPEFSAQSR